MAELYVKPGNRQRGWNDPPQFSYGLQQQRQQRRPAPPGGSVPRGPFRRAAAAAPQAAAREGGEPGPRPPPPLPGPAGPLVPPPGNLPPPGPPASLPSADSPPAPGGEAAEDCQIEELLSTLQETLDGCRGSVQKQVCDDIGKRLVILQEMWTQGKLSSPVRRRMGLLTEELKSRHWDEADEIHRSLMVDHVAEVSQWMVGVKRLIAEAKNLSGGDPPQ